MHGKGIVLRRTYRYRLYPTAKQRVALESQLAFACDLYNAALEQRRDAWRRRRRSISYPVQCRDITDIRSHGMGPTSRLHERVRNIRRDHAFKLADDLIRRFDVIYVEALNLKGLARSRLARDIHDQGWGGFLTILTDKAAEAGRSVIAVDPRNTSQVCSAYGTLVPKLLRERWHRCICGYEADRDVNAARNIYRLGEGRQALTWPTGACEA